MDLETKTKWVEALRSGDYKQGNTALRTPQNGFCCLGVLCDIVNPDGWIQHSIAGWIHEGEHGYPSNSFLEELGVGHTDSRILSKLNDSDGKTFEQIADYIEENL